MTDRDKLIWSEWYRPKTIEDCVLPQSIKDTFKEFISKNEIPNLILAGSAGSGKTTLARALCDELGADCLVVNASLESGIDTLRTKIMQFCSTVSFGGGIKVVILDEAEYLNPNSTQPALRGFIQDFANNVRFILTCNYKNRIIEPLHSRCSIFEFSIPKAERPKMAAKFMQRIKMILEKENIKYDEKTVAALLMKHFPDYRRVLNELQRYSASGVIDEGVLANVQDISLKVLVQSLKEKDFKTMRRWVVDNLDNDTSIIFRKIYDNMLDIVKPNSVPNLVLLLADYQYKSAFCADQEINLVACLTEAMASLEFQ